MNQDTTAALSALRRPDYLGEFANAFHVGRSLSDSRDQPAVRVEGVAQRRAEIYSTIGAALLGQPYAERRAILAHLSPALEKEGLSRAAIARFDPTDDAIASSIQSAHAVGRAVQAGEDR